MNPYEPPDVSSLGRPNTNWRPNISQIWLATCVASWFAFGQLWGELELMFTLVCGLPLWFCVFASFFQFKFTRNTTFGPRSIIAASSTALFIWIGTCSFINTRRALPYRGADIGLGLVLLAIMLLSFFVVPLIAWCFADPIKNLGGTTGKDDDA